ncbi:MAG TPA: rhomboid family intramembrane serine protease [Steroidobacteraceae bacterium]|nr:rhomboid family intramembrane serine protease [Steroidobacteraceae bacterium]
MLMFGNAPGALVIFVMTVGLSLIGLYAAPKFVERSLFRPYWFLRKQQYDTVILSGFVHADLWHLLLNMLTFFFFAFPLERRIGTSMFVALYLVALVLSDVPTYFKHRNDSNYASLGASGAICAVLFANIVYFPGNSLFIMPIPVPIPAPLYAVGYLAYTYYSARQARGRINHDAHLSGAVVGLVFVALTDPRAYGALLNMIG